MFPERKRPVGFRTTPAMDAHAMDNLRFIRETMERAGAFTAVPGWGGITMGVSALIAAMIASRQTTRNGWLMVWMVEGAIAAAIGAFSVIRKARAAHLSLTAAPARKFMFSFVPPI